MKTINICSILTNNVCCYPTLVKCIKFYKKCFYKVEYKMLLPFLIAVSFLGGVVSWISEIFNKKYARLIALIFNILTLSILCKIWILFDHTSKMNIPFVAKKWLMEFDVSWIREFGIDIHLGMDQLSFLLVLLTNVIGILAILCSWNKIKKKQGFFYFNFMFLIAATMGIFLSIDLFLFFCFWELVILPIYFIISIWGINLNNKINSVHIANSFIIFSQISSLIMLLVFLGLVINFHNKSYIWSFDYNTLIHVPLNFNLEYLLMLGLFVAFAIKIPIVPFHTWLINVHAVSPISGFLDLSGFILKTSIYGLLRFCVPFFPNASSDFSNIAIFLGLLTMFYPALIAFSETNIKRIIAYMVVSHTGIMLIGIYIHNQLSYTGVIFQILSSGLSISGMFVLSGCIYKRWHTYDLRKLIGLWNRIKWLSGFLLFFIMVNLGIPGTGNFIGEFLMLLGIFQKSPIIVILIGIGLIISSIYSIKVIQYFNYGLHSKPCTSNVMSIRELSIIVFLISSLIYIGIHPAIILNIINVI